MIYREGDRHFSVSPMFWVGGLITSLLTMMQVGATLVGSSRSDGSVLDVIERERCTSAGGGTTSGRPMANAADSLARRDPGRTSAAATASAT